ncbi:hypothetical protein EW026_g4585 [Hermanssonia centrifuga]|uniref:HNH nuclease domain-containing protein n=1 Tax=Hermanssonia centrifuga TaxID=98765 RepID=A0A4S4KGP2_9APHY|nr:hypothetical protein EW026_g4585 [Hermanssonia centrifuga]
MWLRFATYTILGAHGRLSTSPDALHEPDYDDLVLPLQSRTFYYHFENDSEQARLFVLDPELMNPRSSITQSTNRTSDFKQGVLARDARRCIVTGAARTQAAHLIAHGDQYIKSVTEGRKRCEADVVDTVSDVRNGLSLNAHTHACLNAKDVAFMRVPNFVIRPGNMTFLMDETPPIFDDDHPQYLAHSLVPNAGNMPFMAELPGHRLTTPENRTQWPPTSLFDIVYAGVVWSHFGVKELIPQLRSYHPDSKTARERQKEHLDHEASVRKEARAESHQQRADRRGGSDAADSVGGTEDASDEWEHQLDDKDPTDIVCFLPYMAMSPGSREAALRAAKDARDKKLHDFVCGWSAGVVGSNGLQ